MKFFPNWSRVFPLAFLAMIIGASAANAQYSAAQLRQYDAQLAGHTVLFYDPHHGTQVEYYGSDGHAYLWYPGNQIILTSEYRHDTLTLPIDDSPDSEMATILTMCGKYGSNTYNPVTGTQGGDWECTPYFFFNESIVQVTDGDLFGLAQRQLVPFILRKSRTDLPSLLSDCSDC